ncbi:VOC family protein [Bailinhaonella thermotolerans]|uniref:VOC domain-containing protein n=1 Tax=Bailinhaonella thermotolerans TaxID=1070861 RepID=A0A3A3ZYY0_9ACTN|nr:VOC family protein [Bailinhaonella thermotolerans]RJL20798.1 hypothetical protein D5H75_38730 [Bailinhaonella thermotolerans]
MADPFESLRAPYEPVEPDPLFAERLRDRLWRAVLDRPAVRPDGGDRTDESDIYEGDDMSTVTVLRQGDVGFADLAVPDTRRAAAFYANVLGWRYDEEGRRVLDVTPAHGLWADEGRTLFLVFQVDDVRAAVRRVRAAGGRAEEPASKPYGLVADCEDDQGLRFALYEDAGHGRATESPRPGDLAYVTIEVPDAARARAFWGDVLGWEFTPGSVPEGWNVLRRGAELRPMTGLQGAAPKAAVIPMYAVADVAAAVARVRGGGGTAGEPQPRPYGFLAECEDDQGMRFYLGQLT